MKKNWLSLALALVLCLGLAVPAFASGGDFTITNGILTKYNGSGGAVTIPGGVTAIGESAFEKCSSLTGIQFPSGLTEIGNKAFRDCSGLKSVTIPAGVTRLGERAFMHTGLTSVTVPGSVGAIEFCAFCGCENLTDAVIQEGVRKIGDSVFEACLNLKSVTIPASVTSIETLAFLECEGLTDVYYGGSEAQWKAIVCDYMDFRDELTGATIHYNSSGSKTPVEPEKPVEPQEPETPVEPQKPAEPETPVTPARSGLMTGSSNLPQLSKEEISKLLSGRPKINLYDVEPVFSATYQLGKVSDEALQAALGRLNAMRRIAGLPAASLDKDWCDSAQHGAVVLAALDDLTHNPSKPAGMDDGFYKKGADATRTSNIASGYDPIYAVDGWMEDSDRYNVAGLGHRRWQLSTTLSKVGFGYAGNYSVEKTFMYRDTSTTSFDYDSFGWPSAGNFPNDTYAFNSNTAWSVSLNPKVYAAPSGITVKISGGGRNWTLSGSYSASSSGAFLNILRSDGINYGDNHCIVFRPDGVSKYEGVYTVEISGLKHKDGSSAPFTYSVDFFDAKSDSRPGSSTEKPAEPTTPTTPATPATPTTPTTPTTPANPGGAKTAFTDVVPGSYYEDAVKWAVDNGITNGVTATQFQPGATCTRGQVVTFLWRAKGCPEPGSRSNPFTDVAASSPFYKAILWAAENGITTGNTPTTFNPSGTCSSGHVVTFLWRAKGKPAVAGSSALAATNPGMYYTDAVAWADGAGLLEGTGTAFSPANRSPRADIVTYLYRCEK